MKIDSISFNISPWFLFLLIPIVALVLVPFLTLPKKKMKTPKRIIPTIMHAFICIGIVLSILGLEFTVTQKDTSIMVLFDASSSTTFVRDDMEDYVEKLYENKQKNVSIGVITYGGDSSYDYHLGKKYKGMKDSDVEEYATNLSNALTEASEKLTDFTKNRIIVLSDGKETEGDVEPILLELKDKGVRVDTVYFDSSSKTSEVQISSITGYSNVVKGKKYQISINVDSNVDTTAILEIKDNGSTLSTQDITISKGKNVFTRDMRCYDVNSHTLKISLLDVQKDTIKENNTKSFTYKSEEKQSILIITRSYDEAKVIKSEIETEANVTEVLEKNAPTTISDLIKYDEVILVDVSTASLPKNFDKIAEKYVKEEGKTILTIGGSSTYYYGGMTQKDNAFNNMLPINCDISRGEGNICLMLVIDTSNSMAMNSNRAEMAKEGAIKCVNALNDEDMIGVVSFNGTVTVDVPIQSAKMKDTVTKKIQNLRNSQGTRLYPALEQAKKLMTNFHTKMSKHIILLSDGEPNDNRSTSDYENFAKSMVDEDISISTISIGTGSYGDLMSKIAAAGNGRNYQVNVSSDLPDIMLQETNLAQQEVRVLEEITPAVSMEDDLFNNYDVEAQGIPKLSGYISSILKEGSTCPLKSPIDDAPIYAYKNYGKGIVSSFLSDLTQSKWGQYWTTSEDGKKLIRNMCLEKLPAFRTESTISVTKTFGGNLAKLNIHTLEDTRDALKVSVYDGDKLIEEVTATGSNSDYSCEIKYAPNKNYRVEVNKVDVRNKVIDTLSFNLIPDYSLEYDQFNIDGELNLSNVARMTGGKLFDDFETLNKVELVARKTKFNPTNPISITTLILILVDLAVRFIRIKDLKKMFEKKKKAA